MSAPGWPPLLELRQYTMRPGRRDELIALFDAELVEPQERVGMRACGQFRDLDDTERFVWLRGYPTADADERGTALAAFYGGPTWATHRAAANATMVDSDDVLLLRPVTDGEPAMGVESLPGFGAGQPESVFDVAVWPMAGPSDRGRREWIDAELRPQLGRLAEAPVALFESAAVANTFPALPVREGESVLVSVTRLDDVTAHAAYLRRLGDGVPGLEGELQRLRLSPTSRSRLR